MIHVGHGSAHLSNNEENGIRDAINGHSAKLTNFADQLKDYPRQTANIYADIAFHHGQLGEWGKSFSNYRKSLMTYPFSSRASSKMYVSFKQLIKKRVLRW